MLKAAIEKLVSLKENKTYEIDGRTYSDNHLELIKEPYYSPNAEPLSSLDGVVQIIKKEVQKANLPMFIRIENHAKVCVFDTLDEEMRRNYFYISSSDTPRFEFGWKDYESAMICFRSQFAQTDEIKYITDLLSKITDDKSVSAEDDGVTQTVEVKKGIALKDRVAVRPIVKLQPYRTFMEIEQPTSEFLLRLREGGQVGPIEADGGMWRLEAKKRIREYFQNELQELIESGSVVVMI